MKRQEGHNGLGLMVYCVTGGLIMTVMVIGVLASGVILLPLVVVGFPLAGLAFTVVAVAKAGDAVLR
jgi:hypothetical protein